MPLRLLARCLVAIAAVAFAVAAGVFAQVPLPAQQTPPAGPEGVWHGTLDAGGVKLRLVVQISRAPDGLYTGSLVSVDQGSIIPISQVVVEADTVRIEVSAVGGRFEGRLNAARTELSGTWTQGASMPLVLTKDPSASPPPKPAAPVVPADVAFPLGLPLDLRVPLAPMPFRGTDGRQHAAWELHITNFGPRDVLISKLELLSGDKAIGSYEGAELNGLLAIAAAPAAPERRIVPPGRLAVAYLWIGGDLSALRSIAHRLTVESMTVTSAAVAVDATPPMTLAPPLAGGGWIAANGPAPLSGHRRALIAIDGAAHIAQRFAIDWVRVGDATQTFTGDQKDNRSYRAYGAEALAVADATVVAIKDGIAENVPGPTSRAVPITAETIGGNYVVLDLGGGHFAFYGHLQPGSLRVKPGDRVTTGQVLGLVGNSGNSTEPHLHFHVSNGPSPLGAEGLPYVLTGMEGLTGLPLQNTRVSFTAR